MGENEMKHKPGLPQNVRLSDELGITGRSVSGVASVRSTLAVFEPRVSVACTEVVMKLKLSVNLERLPTGAFQCCVVPADVLKRDAWGVIGEGFTMSEAFMKAAWVFERLEGANPLLLHEDYPELLQDIRSSSEHAPERPPR